MSFRIDKVRDLLREQGIDGVLISKPENIRYLSGFTGESQLFISAATAKLITDFRYLEQAQVQSPDFEVIKYTKHIVDTVAIVCAEAKVLGVEGDYVTWSFYDELKRKLPNIEIMSLSVDKIRMVKDKQELELLEKAVKISDEAFTKVLPFIKPGVREVEIAMEIEFAMRRLGAAKVAFETIVASGARAALPHGIASNKRIASGDLVTMDFGAVYEGYHSDITRTVIAGKASAKQKEIYHIVLAAQLAGVAAVCAGKKGSEVDAVARAIIRENGYGENFGHGLGHGVGLVIHEAPKLSPLGDIVLEENMVVTVEPGIYLPQWGGVRIEDTIVVSATCGKILTASSKHLIELDL